MSAVVKSRDEQTYTTWSGQELTVSQTPSLRVDVSIGKEKMRVREVKVTRSRFDQGMIEIQIPLSPTDFEFDEKVVPDYTSSVKETPTGVEKHKFPEEKEE